MGHRRRRDADRAFGTAPAPHAREAFGSTGASLPWWARERIRLALLLVLLAGTVLALSGRSGGVGPYYERPSSRIPRRYCTSVPPPLARVSVARFDQLRAGLVGVVAEVGGRAYASGIVPAEAVWSDDAPEGDSQAGPANGGWPAGYEMRRWASDPQWGVSYRDDIVGDVFLFAEPRQASRFFDEASDVRCHRAARALAAFRPAGARNLIWRNPDDFIQEDAFLLLGRRVYRISDVRPQKAIGPSVAEQDQGILTVDAVACVIPGANCRRATAGV
jgi:hypothetical protein